MFSPNLISTLKKKKDVGERKKSEKKERRKDWWKIERKQARKNIATIFFWLLYIENEKKMKEAEDEKVKL